MLATNFIFQMVGDRQLQEVSGNSFVTENRAWVFNRGANVKVFALRIVGGDEIEASRVFVINAGRIHETAGTGRLERCRQLANFKAAEIRRQGHESILFERRN